jgi:acyl-CoA synthetase (AMP-forming)/AMP-acid ligase II
MNLCNQDIVLLIQRSSPDFVASFFGAMLAGGVPAPIPPAQKFQTTQDYTERMTGLMRVAQPKVVVVGEREQVALVRSALHGTSSRIITVDELLGAEPETISSHPQVTELALLQFTSGSSGTYRGVRVPFSALETNVAAIHKWLEWTEDDATASWLPVHHDMGLIGCFITAVVAQSDLWLLDPEQFVRSPLRYLQCFGEQGGRLTAMPNFALDHIVRHVRPAMLNGLDFSQWRAVIIGSERLKVESFTNFYELLAPFGLSKASLLPAYGLAEATLGVTGLPLFSEAWPVRCAKRKRCLRTQRCDGLRKTTRWGFCHDTKRI